MGESCFRISPLDQSLLEACVSAPPDFNLIESVLQQGANPMGCVTYEGEQRNLYTAVVDHFLEIGDRAKHFKDGVFLGSEAYVSGQLAQITELLCGAGMDISKPSIPYDGDDILNPLQLYSFYGDGHFEEPLKVLLDHGLSVDDAAKCWDYAFSDQCHVVGHLDDDYELEEYFEMMKKLFLFASYPHIWNNDPDLRLFLQSDQNDYDVCKFRNMDDLIFSIDTTTCVKANPEAYKSTVTLLDGKTGKPVWKFLFD